MIPIVSIVLAIMIAIVLVPLILHGKTVRQTEKKLRLSSFILLTLLIILPLIFRFVGMELSRQAVMNQEAVWELIKGSYGESGAELEAYRMLGIDKSWNRFWYCFDGHPVGFLLGLFLGSLPFYALAIRHLIKSGKGNYLAVFGAFTLSYTFVSSLWEQIYYEDIQLFPIFLLLYCVLLLAVICLQRGNILKGMFGYLKTVPKSMIWEIATLVFIPLGTAVLSLGLEIRYYVGNLYIIFGSIFLVSGTVCLINALRLNASKRKIGIMLTVLGLLSVIASVILAVILWLESLFLNITGILSLSLGVVLLIFSMRPKVQKCDGAGNASGLSGGNNAVVSNAIIGKLTEFCIDNGYVVTPFNSKEQAYHKIRNLRVPAFFVSENGVPHGNVSIAAISEKSASKSFLSRPVVSYDKYATSGKLAVFMERCDSDSELLYEALCEICGANGILVHNNQGGR